MKIYDFDTVHDLIGTGQLNMNEVRPINRKALYLFKRYHTLKGTGGEEIVMSDELISLSPKCIDEMLRPGT